MRTTLLFTSLLFSAFATAQVIELQPFATGFSLPIEMVHAGDDRLFVVEQGGIIKILNADGTTNPDPFLNISDIISTGSEQGLLGLAFHPGYADNGYFYINYTNTDGHTVIARYSVDAANPSLADESSYFPLLTIEQPYANHNGGNIRFGPDGYLYIATGDGGSGGDPENRAQNIDSLLGKLLRIDVDNGAPYGIPASNPFVGTAGADEIWAYGLRNPWKFSFNNENGDLWIADVGQNNIEEINKVSGNPGGVNYGWRCYEGLAPFNTSECSDAGIYTMPVAQYTHAETGGCSITGGFAYTGTMYPNLQGKYLFTDLCNNKIGILDSNNDITYTEAFPGNGFATFGEDINGELLIAGRSTGTIYKITDSSMSTQDVSAGFIKLYPNPAGNETTVVLQSEALITLYDMGGKMLLSQNANQGNNLINTASLQSGIYLLEIKSGHALSRHKLVVQK